MRLSFPLIACCALLTCTGGGTSTAAPQVQNDRKKLRAQVEQLQEEVRTLRERIARLEQLVGPRRERTDPSKLASRRFKALYYAEDRVQIGDFTIDGPVAETLTPLNAHVSKIAVDPERNRVFGRGHHDIYLLRAKEKPLLIEQDPELEDMSWLSAIAWDTKHDRLLASTFAGGGYLYAYYPDKAEWSIVCKPGLGVSALVHAETEDKLFGVNLSTGDEPITSLFEFNARGGRVAERKLSQQIPNAEGYGHTQLVWLDNWLFLIQSRPGPVRGYLIDPSTGVIHRMNVLKPQ